MGHAQPARVGQHPAQRLVHRAVQPAHARHQIDIQAVAPERRIGFGRPRDQFADLKRPIRNAIGPFELGAIDHRAIHTPGVRLIDGIESRAEAIERRVRRAILALPLGWRSAQLAYVRAAHIVVQRRKDLADRLLMFDKTIAS